MIINKGNIEEYVLLLIDGELNAAEETEVMAFIDNHDEYRLLLDQFLDTKLDIETLAFEDKESLLKAETTLLPLKKRKSYMAWAASIAAIIGVGIIFKIMNSDKVSVNSSATSGYSMASLKMDTAGKNTVAIQVVDVVEKKPVKRTDHAVTKQIKENKVVPPVAERVKADELQPLAVADYRTVNIEHNSSLEPVELVPSPTRIISPVDSDETDNAFVSADKLDIFNELADELISVKDNIKEKVKSIRISSLAISFGNKEYTIVK